MWRNKLTGVKLTNQVPYIDINFPELTIGKISNGKKR